MVLKNRYTQRNINIKTQHIYKENLFYKKQVFLFIRGCLKTITIQHYFI